jgi:hypothetical protein
MATMKNNDALKKHHFWILFGLVPLFVLIAVFMISSSVGGKVEARNKEIDDEKGKLGKLTNPKGKGVLGLWDDHIKVVGGKQGNLWKENWDRQSKLYVWPKSPYFVGFKEKTTVDGNPVVKEIRLEDLKFGTKIVDDTDQFDEFKKNEFYLAQFSTAVLKTGEKEKLPPGFVGMVDSILPTQFGNGWQNNLRHVVGLDRYEPKLTSDQVWLMMEDIWVQRSLLQAIKSVNDQMAEFTRVKYTDKEGKVIDDPSDKGAASDPLRRKFKSRVWEVTVEVGRKGNKQYLAGTLENITERLQILGIGKTMTLRVWLDGKRDRDNNLIMGPDGKPDVEGIDPVEFKIGSEFLPGKGGKKPIKDPKTGKDIEVPSNVATEQPDETNEKTFEKYKNLLPPGKSVVEIVKIEQVFDSQTVPVRRIEALELGKTDSRHAAMATLVTNKDFANQVSSPTTTGPSPPGSEPPAGGVLGGGTSDAASPPGSRGAFTGYGSGAAGQTRGGGPITTVIDGNKQRYVEVTDNVRRMPVGIVIVVDQAYIQDAILAFANSPLRFQVTQVTWNRFRDTIGGAPGEGTTLSSQHIFTGMPGQFGGSLDGPADPDGERRGGGRFPMGPGPGGSFRPPGSGSPLGPPGGGLPSPPGAGEPGPGEPGAGEPYPGGYGVYGGTMTAISEAQLTSGLVELGIYGIVSLYEKYDPLKDPTAPKDGDAKEPKELKDKEPMEPADPKDPKGSKEPKEPMPGTPANPKMRVRRRTA